MSASIFKKDSSETLARLMKLAPDEKELLADAVKAVTGTSEEKAEFAEAAKDFPLPLLFKLGENDRTMNDFLETNPELDQQWEKHLTELGYPALPFESVSQEEKCSRFARLKGAFLLSEDKTLSETYLLNKVCDLGMYNGLIMRLNRANDALRKAATDAKGECSESILVFAANDSKKLADLYWSVGFISGANTYFNLANYFYLRPEATLTHERFFMSGQQTTFSWIDKYHQEEGTPLYIEYLKIAMEYFYMAILLADFPQSQQLTKAIYPDKGLFTGLDEKIKNVDDADKYISKFLSDLKVPLPESFKNEALKKAQQDVAEIKKLHQSEQESAAAPAKKA